jgi:hypothetical protein
MSKRLEINARSPWWNPVIPNSLLLLVFVLIMVFLTLDPWDILPTGSRHITDTEALDYSCEGIDRFLKTGELEKARRFVAGWDVYFEGRYSTDEELLAMYEAAAEFIKRRFVVPPGMPSDSRAFVEWAMENSGQLEPLKPVGRKTAGPGEQEP